MHERNPINIRPSDRVDFQLFHHSVDLLVDTSASVSEGFRESRMSTTGKNENIDSESLPSAPDTSNRIELRNAYSAAVSDLRNQVISKEIERLKNERNHEPSHPEMKRASSVRILLSTLSTYEPSLSHPAHLPPPKIINPGPIPLPRRRRRHAQNHRRRLRHGQKSPIQTNACHHRASPSLRRV